MQQNVNFLAFFKALFLRPLPFFRQWVENIHGLILHHFECHVASRLIMQTCAATSPNSLEIYFRTGWWYLQTGSGLLSSQKIKKKSKMAVLGLSGHLLSRYIVHLGLKNTPGLIFEVPGP